MLFLCESCGKRFTSIYSDREEDRYLCWVCLPEQSKAWHDANAAEVQENHRQERLIESERKRIHMEDIL